MTPVEFLSKVWGHSCEEGDWVFLASKSTGGKWVDHPIEYKLGWKRRVRELLDKYPDTEHNLYFCATPFTRARRLGKYVRHVNVLYSDIDTGDPRVRPSILWQSSPGRLQAVWFLRASMEPGPGSELNKSLSYYMDADKGGWDLSQVLRLPGTKNLKYKGHPSVHIVDDNSSLIWAANRIAKRTGHDERKQKEQEKEQTSIPISELTFQQILSKHRRKLSAKTKQLLCQKSVSPGHRSEMLWYLENELQEAGITLPEIYRLIKDSNWNKFRGRRDENHRLESELRKILESKIDAPDVKEASKRADEEIATDLKIETFVDVMTAADSAPGWLVKGWWMKESHGVVAGEPKSFKSTLAYDMAVSVASGEPFLGQYEVMSTGPVIIVQNENARWIMKDRLSKMAISKGLGGTASMTNGKLNVQWGRQLPIYMVNQQSFLLTDPIQQDQLESLVKQIRPALVILDPLYLMFDGDVNSAKDLGPVLNWLMDLRYRYNCGVMLVHHYSKASNGSENRRSGQRMLGSTTIHGWVESAWYIQVESSNSADEEADDVNQPNSMAMVNIAREFRGAGLHPMVDAEIHMGDMGTNDYHVEIELHQKRKKASKDASEEDHRRHILESVNQNKNGVSRSRLQKETGMHEKEFSNLVDRLLEKGLIRKEGQKLVPAREKS